MGCAHAKAEAGEHPQASLLPRFSTEGEVAVTAHEMETAIASDVNESLARYEQIKKFTVLARDFSQEEGELTPTQKLKRNVIVPKYAEVIENMYPSP